MDRILESVLVFIAILVVFACYYIWSRPKGYVKDKMSVVRVQTSDSASLQAMP